MMMNAEQEMYSARCMITLNGKCTVHGVAEREMFCARSMTTLKGKCIVHDAL